MAAPLSSHRPLVLLVLLSLLLLAPRSSSALQRIFLRDIIDVYGQNGSLDLADVTGLLETIVQHSVDTNIPVHAQCMNAEEILAHYGFHNTSVLTEEHLSIVCPALLNKAVLPPCPTDPPTHTEDSDLHVWGYAFLAVTIINLASLLGMTLVPITKKPFFPKVLTYFLGLGVGTLFSNGALQLIPEAFGFDPKADGFVLQSVGVFGGFYALYIVEKILKIVLKPEYEQGHNQCQSSECGQQNPGFTDSEINLPISDKISIASEPASERGSCKWLRGRNLSNVKTVAWMISLSDAINNFIDGITIGASFSVSLVNGFSTSIACASEELPHELGDFIILLNAGLSVPQAAFFNLLSSCSCYFGLVVGILLGNTFSPGLIFALSSGMFFYIALADLLPEMNTIATENVHSTKSDILFFAIQNAGLLTGFAVILLVTLYGGNISLG